MVISQCESGYLKRVFRADICE